MPRWTIGSVLDWSTDYLTQKGADQARLDAELLLAAALDQDRLYLYLNKQQPLAAEELAAYKKLIQRRAGREPVAYILGRRGFWKNDFLVGPGCLIPRPETELLVETALPRLPEETGSRLLELGVGSGAVILSLLRERPEATAVGVDLSPRPLAGPGSTPKKMNLADRLELVEGDLFEPVSGREFDLIVTNPPYVAEGDYPGLAPGDHRLRAPDRPDLRARGAGLPPPDRRQGRDFLAPGGWLLTEIGEDQGRAVGGLFQAAGWTEARILPDLAGLDRVVEARKN